MTHVQVVKDYWDLSNGHDIDKLLTLLDDEVVFYGPSHPTGLKGKGHLRIFWGEASAVSNNQFEIKSIYSDNDTVICEVIESGTLSRDLKYPGEILPIHIPATHLSYRMRVSAFFTFNDKGLISEVRAYWDLASFMDQTGIDYNLLKFALSKISAGQKQLS
jgi:ketosteroid isomerase-like protein